MSAVNVSVTQATQRVSMVNGVSVMTLLVTDHCLVKFVEDMESVNAESVSVMQDGLNLLVTVKMMLVVVLAKMERSAQDMVSVSVANASDVMMATLAPNAHNV